MASLLRASGYAIALFGKWHCGLLPWFSPLKSGWDEWLGNLSGGMDYFSKIGTCGKHDLFENDVEYRDLRYYMDILTERTIEYISREHERPWLLNLNYTTPGVLFHYDGGSVEKYAEMVENLDASIGEVLGALRSTGQYQDTIVVLKSNSGGERFSYQWPLRGEKQDVLDGGIRIPTIARWPAALKGGQVSDLPAVSMDWTRTLLAAAGVDPDPNYPMDGRDLSGYLWGTGEDPAGDLLWRVVDKGALRRGKWKYFVSHDAHRKVVAEKLYDLNGGSAGGSRPFQEAACRAGGAAQRVECNRADSAGLPKGSCPGVVGIARQPAGCPALIVNNLAIYFAHNPLDF